MKTYERQRAKKGSCAQCDQLDGLHSATVLNLLIVSGSTLQLLWPHNLGMLFCAVSIQLKT